MKEQQVNKYYGKSARGKSFFVRFITKLVAIIARILYRPVYYNLEYIPLNQSYMLLGNHHSVLDPVLIHVGMPNFVNWVAKEELLNVPIISGILKRFDAIPLDRGEVDLAAMRKIIQYLQEEKIIGIFPQGGRVDWKNYEQVAPQSGVASISTRYKTTILPFYCDGPYKIFRKNKLYFGAPYCLNPNFGNNNKSKKNQELALEIMRQSYKIVNKPYSIR